MSMVPLPDERLAAIATVLDMFAAAKRDDPLGEEAGFTDLLWSAANAAPLLADEVRRLRAEQATVESFVDMIDGGVDQIIAQYDAAQRIEFFRILGDEDADEPNGILDFYEVGIHEMDNGNQIVIWICRRCPHVQIIARDMDGSQAGLTLAELATAAVRHEEETHGALPVAEAPAVPAPAPADEHGYDMEGMDDELWLMCATNNAQVCLIGPGRSWDEMAEATAEHEQLTAEADAAPALTQADGPARRDGAA